MNMDIEKQLYDYAGEISKRLITSDFSVLTSIVQRLVQAKNDGQSIFTAGNGGSASTASHLCNDLVKGCRVNECEGFRAFCLSDSNAIVTCLANDFSYSDIFSIQLKTYAHNDDILIVFSGSGHSPNIIAVLNTARKMGVFTIGFTGRDGGKMKDLCDLLLIAPTDSMEQIEDMHLIYEHAMISSIREELTLRM